METVVESVTNAVKHSGASRLYVELDWRDGILRVSIEDDGVGGADPEVLAEMAQGHTNPSVAKRLHISLSAVEKHANAIFDKLGLNGSSGYSRRVLAVLRFLGSST